MTIVIDQYTFYTVIILLIVGARIVNSQGGAKIVSWRMLGIEWFMRTEIGPDSNATRRPLKMKIVKSHSLPMYEYKGKAWFTGGPNQTARVWGAPNWVYKYNDARPLPLEQVETVLREVEVTVKESDGKERTEKQQRHVVIAGKPIDAALILSAFENKSIEAFNKLSDKPHKARDSMILLLLVLTMIFAGLSAYYGYLFGWNLNCTLHTAVCR